MSANLVQKLFRGEIKFIAGAAKISHLPQNFLPEIAFVGKSNVGKSSLINVLFNRRNLARVSHTPGRTQQINFFSLMDKVIMVDLPGYGFAKVPNNIKMQWEKLINHYLENRNNLKLVNLLIDARRGIKEHDVEVAKLLCLYNRNFQIVFTKSDKVNDRKILLNDAQILLASLNYSCNVFYTSSRSKEGARELQCSFVGYI